MARGGGARLGESKYRREEGEARWQALETRWKSRRGRTGIGEGMWRGLCQSPNIPLLLLPAPFISASQPPFTSPSKALCPHTLPPSPNPISLLFLSSASFQPQAVPVPKGCWLQ